MTQLIPAKQLDSSGVSDATENKIQPRSFTGFYRRIRIVAGTVLLALYFGVAWIDWGDRQAVLWDLAEKKFHVFSATFWPEDLVLLSAILLICAFGLFFLTALAGRVWCGYACPQSIWMWIFLWAERLAEGDRSKRIKLDGAPLSFGKVARRSYKHGLWLLIGLATGITFVGYFTPIRELVSDVLAMEASGWALFWILFFTGATYLNAGWLRESVCFHMCPYGRFQSSMVDPDSLIIAYDAERGDPRGSRRRDSEQNDDGLGDCIDCQMCVQVCPTGIDIRDGLQMECIGCAACIDACDSIMDKMGYEPGLVRYASQRELSGGKTSFFRPRLVAYFGTLALTIGLCTWGLASRPLVTLDVERDRGIYRFTADGKVENSYQLKLTNKGNTGRHLIIAVKGMAKSTVYGPDGIFLDPGEKMELPFSVAYHPADISVGTNGIVFEVSTLEDRDALITATSTFIGPEIN